MELLIAAGAAAIGGATLGTGVVALGLTGAQIGWMVGSLAGSMLFGPKGPNTEGPRIQEKSVQASTYGNMIPRVYGTTRIAGNVIYARDLLENKIVTEYGKGGGGGSVTTYEYYGTFAVSICEGPISGVRKIWADGILIFSMAVENTEAQFDSEVFTAFGDTNKVSSDTPGVQDGIAPAGLVIYLGTEDQLPDPTIEATHGAATPAFRGQAYAVFSNMALKKFGNRIPNLTVEVVDAGNNIAQVGELIIPVEDGTEGFSSTWQSPSTGLVWGLGYNNNILTIMDPMTKRVVNQIDLERYRPSGPFGTAEGVLSQAVPIPYLRQVWVTSTNVTGCWWVRLSDTGQVLGAVSCKQEYLDVGLAAGGAFPLGNVGGNVYFSTIYALSAAFYIDVTQVVTYAMLSGTLNTGYAWSGPIKPTAITLGCWGDDGYGKRVPSRAVMTDGVYYTLHTDLGTSYLLDYEAGFVADNSASNIVIYDSKRARFIIPGIDDSAAPDNRIVFQIVLGSTLDVVNPTTGPDVIYIDSAIYSPSTDTICIGYTNVTLVYDAETFTYLRSVPLTDNSYALRKYENFAEYGDRLLTWSGYPFATNPPLSRSGLWSIPIGEKLSSNAVPLADIVTAESQLVGLSSSDINVSLLTANVDGFAVTRPASARSVIEQLMVAFQFDAVESSGKIKFVPRGGNSMSVLTIDDLAAHRSGAEVPVPLPINRSDENELPTSVTVRYMSAASDYQVAAQESRRQTGNAFTNLVYDLPVVISDAEAKAVADASLYGTWVARNTVEFSTTFYYADIEPTDIITVDGKLVRVLNKRVEENMLNFKAAFEQGEVYLQGASASETPPTGQTTIDPASRAYGVLMDTVLLRDADNDRAFAFYTAATSISSTWGGATLFVTTSTGTTPVLSYNAEAVIGVASSGLDAYPDNLIDNYNVLRVTVFKGDLSSSTFNDLMLDETVNACVLGSEVMQFVTATEISDGVYDLSGLLRGRRGSVPSAHNSGENFVLLNTATVSRSANDLSTRNVSRDYSIVTPSGTPNLANLLTFTNTGQSYDGLSPALYGGGRTAAGDIVIRWFYRSRIAQNLRDDSDISADAGPFLFTITFSSAPIGSLGITEVITGYAPTFTGPGTIADYTITAAQQTSLFGGLVGTMYYRVQAYSDLGNSQFYSDGVI